MSEDIEVWAEGDIERLAVRIAHHSRAKIGRPITFAGGPGTYPLIGQRCHLVGWSIIETSGAAVASLAIINGTTAGAPAVAPINLAIGGMSALTAPLAGILCDAGLAVVVTAGAVSGTLFYTYAD